MTYLSDCEKCMQANPKIQRQQMGCGYESAIDADFVWMPEGMRLRPGETMKHCAGYTCRLPEVIEIARARVHWDKGSIESFCDGRPTDAMLLGIEVLDASANELQGALMTPRSEGGLRGEE